MLHHKIIALDVGISAISCAIVQEIEGELKLLHLRRINRKHSHNIFKFSKQELATLITRASSSVNAGEIFVHVSTESNEQFKCVRSVCEELNFSPVHLVPFQSLYHHLTADIESAQHYAVVNIGAGMTRVVVLPQIQDGRALDCKTLSFGGVKVTQSIADTLDISYSKAELLKLSYRHITSLEQAEEWQNVMLHAYRDFFTELHDYFRQYQSIQQIIFTGGGSLVEGIEHLCVPIIARQVKVSDPRNFMHLGDNRYATLTGLIYTAMKCQLNSSSCTTNIQNSILQSLRKMF